MSFLNALGGIGQGITMGIQDWERMDEAKYRKEQQARQKRKDDQEDAFEAEMAGLDANEPDYNKRAAAVAAKNARHRDAAFYQDRGAQAEDRTRRLKKEDIAERTRVAGEAAANAAYLHKIGNHKAALRVLQGVYDIFPDGRQIVTDEQKGTWGIATPDGKWEVAPRPLDKDGVGEAVNYAMMFKNPALWKQFEEVAQADRKLAQGDKKLTQDGQYQTGMLGVYQERNKIDRDQHVARQNAGGYGHAPSWQPLGISDDGTQMLGISNGRVVQQPIPTGYGQGAFPKLTPKDNVTKAWSEIEKELIKNGSDATEVRAQQTQFYARRGYAPPEAEAVMQSGVNPKTGKPLTAAEINEFNRRYPKSAVKPTPTP